MERDTDCSCTVKLRHVDPLPHWPWKCPICLVLPLLFAARRSVLKVRGRAGSIPVHNQVGRTRQHVDGMSLSETAPIWFKNICPCVQRRKKTRCSSGEKWRLMEVVIKGSKKTSKTAKCFLMPWVSRRLLLTSIYTQHDIAWARIMWAFNHSVVNVDASLEAILTTGWNELRKVYVLFQKSRMILAVQ